jgi:hypothetical protein
MSAHLDGLLSALKRSSAAKAEPNGDVISVSDTVSAAASVYESVRNTLEYDEEHLLRRNAIRRILKRRLSEADDASLSADVLRELIWARYLPNRAVPEARVADLSRVFAKYRPMFAALSGGEGRHFDWLLDVLSTEIEYTIAPPIADEALASFAYQELRPRMVYASSLVAEADWDLQLYVAIHRTVLKSNAATLRFRLMTLYYPEWTKADAESPVVREIAIHLPTVIASVERQLTHPAADAMFRLVRRHAVVFHILRDVAQEDPDAFERAAVAHDADFFRGAIASAASARYDRFRTRLRRGVLRAVFFLLLTKFVLALLIELPYERLVLKSANWLPFAVNTLFHPILLGIIGLSVSIPEKRNTAKITEEALAVLRLGPDFRVTFKVRRPWAKGPIFVVFQVMYAAFFLLTVGLITVALRAIGFNGVSIGFFLFFLSLVTFYGLKIRMSRKELVIVEGKSGFFGPLADMLFLPIVRAGRWLALRAPRLNVFLFFFDFIVEAPFKATIRLIEGWLAFLREKREEIT